MAPTRSAMRSMGQRIRTCGAPPITASPQRTPPEVTEEGLVALLHRGVEAQHAPAHRLTTRFANESGTDPARVPSTAPHDETPARPPADVARGGRRESHPAEHVARGGGRDQHDRAGVVVDVVVVGAGEEPLLADEHVAPDRAVRGEIRGIRHPDHPRGRLLRTGCAGQHRHVEHHAPAVLRMLHAPHAAHPAF
ncbi:hypothetical protein QE414_000696 [Microbacterium sp. SORGH_AS 344]|nr:hypothetical protein [Microbacterium sp. SORGH_AS_0344]MDQ1082689.1 hypothetical protein [Microbacterium sp. SORGH_AS_0344]